jgi:lipopolysaccharide transport system permease protein
MSRSTSPPEPAQPRSAPDAVHGIDGSGAAGNVGVWIGADPPRVVHALRRILDFPRLLVQHRDFVSTTVKRELQSRFTGTLLGWLWPLVYPVFMFVVYYFVFVELLQQKIDGLTDDLKPAMGVFMFTGIIVWTGFAEGLSRGTLSIVENANLIKKLVFPTELLPLNSVLVAAVTMGFGILAYLVATLFGVWPTPTVDLLWIPAILPLQLLFTYGLALFLATCNVFLRDTQQLVALLTTVWMFLTPIFWIPSATVMGEDIAPYLEPLENNPLHHMMHVWRSALMNRTELLAIEDPLVRSRLDVFEGDPLHSLLIFGAWAVGVFVVGFVVYALSQRRFADEI